jgi:hypothetical protein
MVKRMRLHLGRIEDELCDVQRHFPAINALLNCSRDDFTDTLRQNMLMAYEFLDAMVHDEIDLKCANNRSGGYAAIFGRLYS